MPKNMEQKGSVVHRRASSLEPTYRGGSPAPRGGGRGVSLDRGAGTPRKGQRPATSHLAQVSEEDDSSRSVNFSRPMSPGAPGTRQDPSPPTSHGWFGGPVVNQEAVQRMALASRPKTSGGGSAYDRQNAQRSVQSASERPVKTHQIAQGVQGSRLNTGSMRVQPSGTAVQSQSYLPRQAPQVVDPNSPDAVYDPSTRKFIHKQDAMARHRELHEEPEPTRQYVSQHVDSFHSVHIPENQMGRGSPSPIRHYVRQEQPVPQRREEPAPRVETTTMTESRVGAGAVPHYSDDFADADVQPQEQANASRMLEDSGYGTIVGQKVEVSSPVVAKNQDSSYPRLPPPTNTPAGQGRGSLRAGHDRNASLSPPRNAHFAPVAVELTGLKHDPLPRSVSPAKSALKSSPSVSRRAESPQAPNGRLQGMTTSSDASDSTFDDVGRQQKKTVRVSFEEEPAVAAGATQAESAPFSGPSQSKWSPIAEKEDEFEDFMKPRAALPVFGSIRGKERRPQEDVAEKVTETVPIMFASASAGTSRVPLQASSDMSIGNVVAHDFAQKQSASNDPLPPEVTTVEGSGYVSDSASEYSDTYKHANPIEKEQQTRAPEPKSLSTSVDAVSPTSVPITERVVEVPNIALQPATPSPYERPEPKFQSMMIPGGWGDDDPESEDRAFNPSQTTSTPLTSAPSVETVRQQSAPVVHTEEDDTTDDNSSVYSDAYEDLSDGEGGFGSIDALMTVAPASSGLMHSKYADKSTDKPTSKLRQETYADDSRDTPTPTQDWNAAQQRWHNLNLSLKQPQQAEPLAAQDPHAQDVIARVMEAPVVAPRSIPTEYSPDTTPERKVAAIPPPNINTPSATQLGGKPLKSALKKSAAQQPAPQAESQSRMITKTAAAREGPSSDVPQMKRTMRGGPSTSQAAPQMGSTMRSSMRGGPDPSSRAQPQMRRSMRSADTSPAPGPGLAASRHSMGPIDSKPPRGALQKRNIPPAAVASKPRPQSMPAAKQVAAPVPTYDSDSDASASSFQRTRKRGSRDQGGRSTMRGSMRQEPAPTMRASAPAPRQVRAISPPASPSPAMRRSMRPSSPSRAEPVKSSKFSIRSLSPMGRFRKGAPDVRPASPTQPKAMPIFNKQPKPSKQKAPAAKPAKAAFSSRFADSSDEDDDRQPRHFQSRFDDSDDDEPMDYKLPPGLTPVRGIPRKAGEEDGDSTDLEEEADDASVAAKPATITNGTNGNANGQGAALSAGSLRDSKHAPGLPTFEASDKTKKKRGFFGLGKKKNTTALPEPAHAQAVSAPAASAPDEIPIPPTQRNRDMGFPMTPIEEDKEFGDPAPISPASKKPPKLQRRSTPEWPLPPVLAIGTDDRPVSSDGVAPRRPRFAMRQSSAVSNVSAPILDAQGRSVSYGRSGKKKKFQGLRRVFGLND
jgi:serine/arginine repetitive matrix protein 2